MSLLIARIGLHRHVHAHAARGTYVTVQSSLSTLPAESPNRRNEQIKKYCRANPPQKVLRLVRRSGTVVDEFRAGYKCIHIYLRDHIVAAVRPCVFTRRSVICQAHRISLPLLPPHFLSFYRPRAARMPSIYFYYPVRFRPAENH